MSRLQDLVAELKRRRVFRALAGWGVISFALLQIVEPLMHALDLPDWILKAAVIALGFGFPVTVIFAWAFDLKVSGIERTAPIGEATPGRAWLAVVLVGVGLLVAAPGVTWYLVSHGRDRGAGSTPPAAAGPSVAVLPFADMSPGKDQEYLADGVAEEILNALVHVDGLRVPGRTSSWWFKGKNPRLADVGRELGVGAVLEGSVRKVDSRVRITAQLVSVADGFPIWSETFDRELTDIFRIQDEIAGSVASALRVKLLPASGGQAQRRTTRIDAYERYLLGRQLLGAGSPASIRGARGAFERALALDPRYAPAHAGLATAWGASAGFLAETPEEVTRYALLELASAERAIALDPDLPDGYVARANHRLAYLWDWKGGLADVERALSLGARDADTKIEAARALAAAGRLPDGLRAAKQATEIDPLSVLAWMNLARMRVASGDLPGAEEAARRGLEIAPESPGCTHVLGLVQVGQGKHEEAVKTFERNPFPFWRLEGLARVYHRMGRDQDSRAALQQLVDGHGMNAAYQIAEVHAERGEPDAAFEWLERARVQHDEGLEFFRFDAPLQGLHGDPRWNAFLRRMGVPLD